jgi:hypothetical protein
MERLEAPRFTGPRRTRGTIRGLRGDGSDERFRAIDRNAALLAGFVPHRLVIVVVFVEIAHNCSGSPTR